MGNPQRNARAIGEPPKPPAQPPTPPAATTTEPKEREAEPETVTFRRDDPALLDHLRATIAELEAVASDGAPPEPRPWSAEPEWSAWAMRSTPRGFEWCRVLLTHADVEANQVGTRHAPDNRGIVIAKIENDMRSDRMSDRRGWERNSSTTESAQ
jgi:hypothetical protein